MTNPRFQNIGAILAKTPDQPAPDLEAAEVQPEDPTGTVTQLDPTPSGKPEQIGRTKASPARRRPTSATASGGVRRVAFRLAPDLYGRLAATATAERVSHGQIVLDAVEAAAGRDELTALTAGPAENSPAGLFPRLPQRAPAAATIPVEIRIDARAVDILDQLVTQSGADNRTQLITAALRSHLTNR